MNFNWDVVTGVGSGALNAAILSMYTVDQTKAASEKLETFWKDLKTENVYTPNDWLKMFTHIGYNSLGILD